jgi:nuclear transport factor 2 (NTF2) superfamily protein
MGKSVTAKDDLARSKYSCCKSCGTPHSLPALPQVAKELEYRLIKELWAFSGNRIAVRFAYESHDDSGNWFRSYGNENWEFGPDGLMQRRFASINDLPIRESDRKFRWPLGRRPEDHPGLSELGL